MESGNVHHVTFVHVDQPFTTHATSVIVDNLSSILRSYQHLTEHLSELVVNENQLTSVRDAKTFADRISMTCFKELRVLQLWNVKVCTMLSTIGAAPKLEHLSVVGCDTLKDLLNYNSITLRFLEIRCIFKDEARLHCAIQRTGAQDVTVYLPCLTEDTFANPKRRLRNAMHVKCLTIFQTCQCGGICKYFMYFLNYITHEVVVTSVLRIETDVTDSTTAWAITRFALSATKSNVRIVVGLISSILFHVFSPRLSTLNRSLEFSGVVFTEGMWSSSTSVNSMCFNILQQIFLHRHRYKHVIDYVTVKTLCINMDKIPREVFHQTDCFVVIGGNPCTFSHSLIPSYIPRLTCLQLMFSNLLSEPLNIPIPNVNALLIKSWTPIHTNEIENALNYIKACFPKICYLTIDVNLHHTRLTLNDFRQNVSTLIQSLKHVVYVNIMGIENNTRDLCIMYKKMFRCNPRYEVFDL
uniref:Putative inhibitor of apoptosis 1 diap1 n=1 Tax=Ixodes ricinus TaxID=34613 RepID=A0A0K8RJ35_IXORI